MLPSVCFLKLKFLFPLLFEENKVIIKQTVPLGTTGHKYLTVAYVQLVLYTGICCCIAELLK